MSSDAAHDLLSALARRGLTVATAESVTGGGLGALLTAVPGASAAYLGGVVAYSTRLKRELLEVPEEVVAAHGVVSAECARAMAAGVRVGLGADLGISTTGVAGPDRQEGKPVGLVYVAVAGPLGVRAFTLRLTGDRSAIRRDACVAALEEARSSWRGLVPAGMVSPDG